MANNLFADVPAAVVATQTISFASAGFDTSNTRIIYEVGSPLKSYVPGRAINAVTSFTTGNGYYIVPKLDMDKTAYLIPPIPSGGGGGGGSDPLGAHADLTFTVDPQNIANTSQVFSSTFNGANWGNGASDSLSAASGVSARIWFKHVAPATGGFYLAFSGFNAYTPFGSLAAGITIAGDGSNAIGKLENGVYTSAGITAINNHYYGVYRDGTTGNFKLQESADEITWNDIATLSSTPGTGHIFVNLVFYGSAGDILRNPKGAGLS